MKVVALAGGVGAARFLRGLVRVVAPGDLTVVVNTGDDLDWQGLRICPDLDSITYTLGGGVHPEQGWGRADERHVVAGELTERYGQPDWFTLGDRDLATHLVRTQVLGAGGTLSEATRRIAQAWGLDLTLLPMSDQRVTTRIHTTDGRVLHFQQWWIRERAKPDVARVELDGIHGAVPAPGVLGALLAADAVVLCPSNPVVSLGPVLAVPGLVAPLSRVPVVGVSPIVAGAVVRGMADRLLPATGTAVSAAAVAGRYAPFLDGWVMDDADADAAGEVAATGVATAVTDTIMDTEAVAEAVARTVLDLAQAAR